MFKKAFSSQLPPAPPFAHAITHKLAHKLSYAIPKLIKTLPEPPFFMQKKLGEKLLGKLLAEQIEMGEFEFLHQRWLKISINDMGINFYLTSEHGKLTLGNHIKKVDVSFSGDSREFILLASRSEDPDTLFFQRRLIIEGDTELGLYIKNAIDGTDFDNWPTWLNTIIKKIAIIAGNIEAETQNNKTAQFAR
jgi:predicted lipid carrier protein YhbT